MKTVFIPPIVDYNFLKQLPQQMADQFNKNGYNVIYCGIQNNLFMKRQIRENFTVYSNVNYALKDIKENKIKIDIIYNTWSKNYIYTDILKPDITIYHSCDSFDEWKSYEPSMLKAADLVFCTSKLIYDMRSKECNKVHICRNGCNEEMINRKEYKEYESFKFVKRPIFGFSGAIGKWVQTNFIKNIADKFYTAVAGLRFGKDIPLNVKDLGVMSHEEVIDFYYNCDFGLLPFNTKSEITLAANPIKLWEYLACGLPILATSWEETELPELKDVVFTANDKDQFLAHAEYMALLSPENIKEIKEECYKVAMNNTWEVRFDTIRKELEKL